MQYTFRDLIGTVSVPAVTVGTETSQDVISSPNYLWILLSLVALAAVFHCIYVVCDEHLVPGKCVYCVLWLYIVKCLLCPMYCTILSSLYMQRYDVLFSTVPHNIYYTLLY
jgi:hypothetical protein